MIFSEWRMAPKAGNHVTAVQGPKARLLEMVLATLLGLQSPKIGCQQQPKHRLASSHWNVASGHHSFHVRVHRQVHHHKVLHHPFKEAHDWRSSCDGKHRHGWLHLPSHQLFCNRIFYLLPIQKDAIEKRYVECGKIECGKICRMWPY